MASSNLDCQEYAEQHNLVGLFSNMLQDLTVARPEDPLEWMIDFLKVPKRRIIVTGAPASGKGTQCEKIVEKYGVVHLSTGDLLRAAVKAGSPLGLEADNYMKSGQLVPDQLVIDLVKEKLNDDECSRRGWLLDGFPRTRAQALSMQASGILPTHVIQLNVPDEDLMDRALGRRLDPETGKIYHIKTNPPPADVAGRCIQRSDDQEEKVRNRLNQYHANLIPLCEAFKSILVSVDGNRSPQIVFEDVDKLLSQSSSSQDRAHRVPRIVLFGPPHSGVRTLSHLLVKRFGVILIDGSQIDCSDDSAASFSQLVRLLSQRDSMTNGYLLVNSPRSVAQITLLQNIAQIRPYHTICLSVPADELLRRGSELEGQTTRESVEEGCVAIQSLLQSYDEVFNVIGQSPVISLDGTGDVLEVFGRAVDVILGDVKLEALRSVVPLQ
ncbi:putative Adenylate kinase, chloroplastic [Blattamonas nauphoetae]|uniref:Adenylate kinase, chloroplastic n=1 Tax=Blattamonas nauphoetae TaxID=2049346 RepID=A0ABQ9Y5X2_9EUKA|nr:putative Adenylate kinase, chloroplastic [Blattamonas nauphoetae]